MLRRRHLLAFVSFIASSAYAQLASQRMPANTEYQWGIASLSFTSPLPLTDTFTGERDDSKAGTEADPYRFNVEYVYPPNGKVLAKVQILAFFQPEAANFAVESIVRVKKRGFNILSLPSREDLKVDLPMATGYLAQRQATPSFSVKYLILHLRIEDKFIELELSSAEENFTTFEPYFRRLVASVKRMAK